MRKILLVLTMMSMLIFTACGNDSDSIVTTASTTTEAVTTEPSQTENPVTVTHSEVSEPDITEPAVTTEAVSEQTTTTTTVVSEEITNPVTVTDSEVTTVTTTAPVTTEKTTTAATTKPATTTAVPTTAEQTTTTAVTFETSAAVEQLKLDILGYGNYNYEEYYDKFGNYILKMYHIWGAVQPSFYNDKAEWLYSDNGVIKYKTDGTPYLRSEIVVSYYDEEQEAELLRLINEARAANGLTTLVQDEDWAIFADRYAKFMADEVGLKHSGCATEIIGRGQDTAQRMFDDFWNSEGHRSNILDTDGNYVVTHCAVSRYYAADVGWYTVVVLEDMSYQEHFTPYKAMYTEEHFANGDASDEWILKYREYTPEQIMAELYKPEYNAYYPHLAQ